nr:substrate-binding domain-containing protein [Haloechinothrix aidingensis]
MRSRTTHTIGMVVPRISNPFFATMVEAIEQQLQEGQRSLLLGTSHYDPDVELRQIQALLDRRVDALITIPCHRERSASATQLASTRVPTVQLDLRLEGNVSGWVGVDNDAGIVQVIEHVLAGGARSLAFVGASPSDSSSQERLDSYRRAATRLDGPHGPVLLGDFTIEWGQEAATRLLDGDDLPDAIVCGNDTIALGVLRALTRRGVRVPDDVQVTGFDDIAYAELAEPPLTTIRQPQRHMAAEVVRMLTDQLSGATESTRRVAVVPELIVRASTASE